MPKRRPKSCLPSPAMLRRLVTALYVATTLVGLCTSAWVKEGARAAAASSSSLASDSAKEGLGAAAEEKVGRQCDTCTGTGAQGGEGSGVGRKQCISGGGAAARRDPSTFTPYVRRAGGSRIVFISVGLEGHAVPLIRLAQEMMRRGYNASVVSHDNLRRAVEGVPGLEFISAGPLPLDPEDLRERLRRISGYGRGAWGGFPLRSLLSLLSDVYLPLSLPLYKTPLDPALLLSADGCPPDLVVLDVSAAGACDLADELDVPLVFNSPTLLFRLHNRPSHLPAWGSGFPADMTMLQRCLNLVFPRLLSVTLTPALIAINRARRERKLVPLHAQEDLFRGQRVLVNSAMGLEYPQALSPLITMTGPLLPPAVTYGENLTLPPVISNWMQYGTLAPPSPPPSPPLRRGEKKPAAPSAPPLPSPPKILYVCLGHMPQLSPSLTQALLDGLSPDGHSPAPKSPTTAEGPTNAEPPLRVLWMLPPEQRDSLPPTLPPNVRAKVMSDLPHLQMLAHPSVHAVISHCGLSSAQEALYFHKPLLCLPFFSDQHDVAARVTDAGAGLSLFPREGLTADNVRSAVHSLLSNHTIMSEKAAALGAHLKAAGGVKAAGDALEQTLRMGGSAHLRPYDLDVPWHVAHMLDVYVLSSALIALVAGLLIVLASTASLALQALSIRLRERMGSQEAGGGGKPGADRRYAPPDGGNGLGNNGHGNNGHGNGHNGHTGDRSSDNNNNGHSSNGRPHVDGPLPPPGSEGATHTHSQSQSHSRPCPPGTHTSHRPSSSSPFSSSSSSHMPRGATSNGAATSSRGSQLGSVGGGVWPEAPLASLGLGKPRAPFFDLGANLGLEDFLPTASGKEKGGAAVGQRRGRGEDWLHRDDVPLFDRCVEATR